MRISGYLYVLEQFVCALCLLWAAGRIVHAPAPPPWRILLCALLCAIASLLAALHSSFFLHTSMLILALASPLALWPGLPRRIMHRMPPTLFFLSLLWTGCIRFLSMLPLPPWLVLSAACCCTAFITRTPATPLPPCASLEIRCGTAHMEVTALIDTGNLLRDPLTALPVIVISRRAARRLIPAPAPTMLNPGLRRMPIRTVAGPSSMVIFRPDRLRLLHQGDWVDVQAMLGVAPDSYDGVQALAPASLLEHAPSITQGG